MGYYSLAACSSPSRASSEDGSPRLDCNQSRTYFSSWHPPLVIHPRFAAGQTFPRASSTNLACCGVELSTGRVQAAMGLFDLLMDVGLEKFSVELGSPIAPIVTNEPSNYDPALSGGLKINVNEPLVVWCKGYRRHHGLAPIPKNSSRSQLNSRMQKGPYGTDRSEVTWYDASIDVGPARFRFHRTLRVPDDGTRCAHPPGLGSFPLAKTSYYSDTLPEYIAQRGGYIMPLFQREAMWISISAPDSAAAIKISAGGINVISGNKQDESPQIGVQDYIVGHKQQWLDGFATEPGVVRQFVSMKLGHGFTVEEQLSNCSGGGIQIDVFPSLFGVMCCFYEGLLLPLGKCPKDLNIDPGKIIEVKFNSVLPIINTLGSIIRYCTLAPALNVFCRDVLPPIMQIFYKGLDGKTWTLHVHSIDTIYEVKGQIQNQIGIPAWSQRLIYGGKQLEDQRMITILRKKVIKAGLDGFSDGVPGGRMGLAAGGKIVQTIYKDQDSPIIYDDENPSRVFIHTVSTIAWEMITGTVCPITPITPALYKAHDYPWYSIYEEGLPAVNPTGKFDNIQSVHQMDYVSATELVDPKSPPDCARHPGRTSKCISRPCSHPACGECFGDALFSGGKCPVCSAKVEKHVAFDKPAPKVISGGGGTEATWWEMESQLEGVSVEDGNMTTTCMLVEDRVSALHGASADP
ncbi:hypothetical protein DL96DRAFT_1751790 [Flagelloscypha sp. PMI_526]|nr:hypothetical protein DL96DRAFT_1751790 [Flagelloscypha sp. PMI_526]